MTLSIKGVTHSWQFSRELLAKERWYEGELATHTPPHIGLEYVRATHLTYLGLEYVKASHILSNTCSLRIFYLLRLLYIVWRMSCNICMLRVECFTKTSSPHYIQSPGTAWYHLTVDGCPIKTEVQCKVGHSPVRPWTHCELPWDCVVSSAHGPVHAPETNQEATDHEGSCLP